MSPLAGVRDFLSSHTQVSSNTTGGKNDFPPVPPSLNTDHYELRDYQTSQALDRRPAHSAPQYTPYLGLQARLSQSWINKWTILLLLVLFRVLLAVKNLDNNISNAKSEALSACTSVESIGSAMASMPHYMSAGVNTMAAAGISSAVNALITTLLMTITGVEEIVLFVINMLTSTYACLITLVVDGSISAAISMIEDVADFMNKTIKAITSDIASDIKTFEADFNTFISAISDVTSLVGGSKTAPSMSVNVSTNLASLTEIQIPSSFDAGLEKVKANLPTFSQVQNLTNTIISIPFEEVKKLVNESLGTYTFDKSIFPVAQKQALTFCSDNNTIGSFFDDLASLAVLAKKIFIAVMVILAVLACIPMAYREIWRYRTMVQRSQLLQKHAFDPMDVMYIASRPYTTTAGIKLAARFQSSKRQILVRWAVAYATSIPALFVLALGVAGLLSAFCQYLLLKTIQKEVPALASEVGDFAGTVVNALTNASTAWAVGANSVINTTQTNINHDVFGWVNTTTHAINATINTFVDESTSVLNTTFGGTVLYDPLMATLNCLVGLKVQSIQKGLTWVSDNAYITIPEFNPDVFSLGAAATLTNSTSDDSFLSSPGTSTSDDVTGAITKLTSIVAAGIREEAYIAAVLVGIWVLIALIGIVTALVNSCTRDKTRGEGGAEYNIYERSSTPPPPFEQHQSGGQYASHNQNEETTTTNAFVDGRKFPRFSGVSRFPSAKSDPWSAGSEHEEHRMDVVAQGQGSVVEHKGHVRASSYGWIDEKGVEGRGFV